jgi:hypothetical protein
MNFRNVTVKYGVALSVAITMWVAVDNAQARPKFEARGEVMQDQRYLWTNDVRGWSKAAKRGAPFRTHRAHISRKRGHHRAEKTVHAIVVAQTTEHRAGDLEILPHPSGCPRRAFCGCGAAVRIFGAPIRTLWLAANWFRFPPAAPAPGMIAVRRHHVFVIERVIDRRRVVAYDANSGGHLTRRHVRSLAGYSVRNPQG